ncbi:hypothetical protein GCM10022223_24040 [Kineosporia mesophila]|uniref:Uncharacterized protein n=1 Tax=Kineosporia mesophila TaxID=566012 RepID=A0ABP6ZFB2_9ACTN|nr:hypothetical protein [Kineosporia mesophila]MCD5354237.1 hypothetical protein [Kineosporia mesophila]
MTRRSLGLLAIGGGVVFLLLGAVAQGAGAAGRVPAVAGLFLVILGIFVAF